MNLVGNEIQEADPKNPNRKWRRFVSRTFEDFKRRMIKAPPGWFQVERRLIGPEGAGKNFFLEVVLAYCFDGWHAMVIVGSADHERCRAADPR